MWLQKLRSGLKYGFTNNDRGFIRRWPKEPRVVFYGPPNAFKNEIAQRYISFN